MGSTCLDTNVSDAASTATDISENEEKRMVEADQVVQRTNRNFYLKSTSLDTMLIEWIVIRNDQTAEMNENTP